MMNGLNILPSYTDYFTLTTTTLALNTASVWMGSAIAGICYAKVPDWVGRKWSLFFGAVFTIIGVVLQTAAQNIAMFVIARIIIGFGTGRFSFFRKTILFYLVIVFALSTMRDINRDPQAPLPLLRRCTCQRRCLSS